MRRQAQTIDYSKTQPDVERKIKQYIQKLEKHMNLKPVDSAKGEIVELDKILR